MGSIFVDLQIATENIEGLPTEEQIVQWATAAVQPEGDEVEMTVRIVDEAESHELNLTYVARIARLTCFHFRLNAPMRWSCHC